MKALTLATLLTITAASATAQNPTREEYRHSPVTGTEWNCPANLNPFIPGYFADPTIRKFGDTYYIYATTDGTGNGYFNRMYLALSKNFNTPWGKVGAHLAYQYNRRSDYRLNGPCAAVTWRPVWLCDLWLLDELQLIAEYDSRTVNAGFIASV